MENDYFEKERDRIEREKVDIPMIYKKYGIEFYQRAIDSSYQIVVFIGVVCGFGFTAISFTESKLIFFVAESCLLSIAYLISARIQKLHINEYQELFDGGNRALQRKQIEEHQLNDAIKEHLSADDYRAKKSNPNLQAIFTPPEKPKPEIIPYWWIWLVAFFAVMLLVSFVWRDIIVFCYTFLI